jgi:hypothetical protein
VTAAGRATVARPAEADRGTVTRTAGREPVPTVPAVEQTIVWIDAEGAVVVSWRNMEATVVRLASDVPPRRRSVGHIRHDPLVRHGGGASQAAGDPRRLDRLAHFTKDVRALLPSTDALTILGSGPVRERLEREVRDEDRIHRRNRQVTAQASPRLTERQLIARVRRLAGDPPRRRRVGRTP